MTTPAGALGTRAQRTLGLIWLLFAGILSLPLSATLLDRRGTENLVLPAQLIGMAVLGAATTLLVPALAPSGAGRGKVLLVGAALGVGAAVVGVALFWLLISGFSGA